MIDLTVAAIPLYFGSMGVEYVYLKRQAETREPIPGDYTRNDTIASLAMGVGSLLAPFAWAKLLGPVTPGKGRYGKWLVAGAAGAVGVTTIADFLARLDEAEPRAGVSGGVSAELSDAPPARAVSGNGARRPAGTAVSEPRGRRWRRKVAKVARKVSSAGGVASVVAGGVAITTAFAALVSPERMWNKRFVRDLGTGPLAVLIAIFGWDFIYYWNHRFMHTARYMWAVHVVHHSSEHYNLSTALRQPVADPLATFVPYGLLSLVGIRPELISMAHGVNLIYQYWIHTETIDRIGPPEAVLNTASHHRVHHGSQTKYIDRNHGSILIVWDKLFGTFVPEQEPVIYGLTKNLGTDNWWVIATHEHKEMLSDVAASTNWRDRISYVLRGPGWAYEQRALREAVAETEPPVPERARVAAPTA